MGRVWLGLVSGTVQQNQTFMVFSVHRQTNTVELRLAQYPLLSPFNHLSPFTKFYPPISPFIPFQPRISPNIPLQPRISPFIPQYPPLSPNIPHHKRISPFIPLYSPVSFIPLKKLPKLERIA